MSLPSEIQVLVVGAGPTGLTAAIALDKLGLQVAVVDAALTNPVGSRAAVIHSHTLEVSIVPFMTVHGMPGISLVSRSSIQFRWQSHSYKPGINPKACGSAGKQKN